MGLIVLLWCRDSQIIDTRHVLASPADRIVLAAARVARPEQHRPTVSRASNPDAVQAALAPALRVPLKGRKSEVIRAI